MDKFLQHFALQDETSNHLLSKAYAEFENGHPDAPIGLNRPETAKKAVDRKFRKVVVLQNFVHLLYGRSIQSDRLHTSGRQAAQGAAAPMPAAPTESHSVLFGGLRTFAKQHVKT